MRHRTIELHFQFTVSSVQHNIRNILPKNNNVRKIISGKRFEECHVWKYAYESDSRRMWTLSWSEVSAHCTNIWNKRNRKGYERIHICDTGTVLNYSYMAMLIRNFIHSDKNISYNDERELLSGRIANKRYINSHCCTRIPGLALKKYVDGPFEKEMCNGNVIAHWRHYDRF